ncbi:hypothetical protein BS50DRAFT_104092 [Corynespora cassiicola Philippines]|uniref:Uncharacterized protein n=1 Tax=Corynespora cassiicola Philippines TaxID=1448308 RepID=A0A2T2NCB2_CORCC|nr:hypothetical protein BS50DRAFT_104092 [Corynespora cassiicola Philippines]
MRTRKTLHADPSLVTAAFRRMRRHRESHAPTIANAPRPPPIPSIMAPHRPGRSRREEEGVVAPAPHTLSTQGLHFCYLQTVSRTSRPVTRLAVHPTSLRPLSRSACPRLPLPPPPPLSPPSDSCLPAW